MITKKDFYKAHSQKVRLTPRIVYIISMVLPWIKGARSILDVGCGNRYITSNMSIFTKEICGIDIEDDIVNYREDRQYDVVTCFDMLEHIGKENLQKALDNISSMVGKLLIINQPEQQDKSQPIDELVTPLDLQTMLPLKMIYLERYKISQKESYNFMVFKR